MKRRIFVNYLPDHRNAEAMVLLDKAPEVNLIKTLCVSKPVIDVKQRGSFSSIAPTHSWDSLRAEAEKEPCALEVLALGPLTEIAVAFLRWPDLPGKIKRLTVSGGSLFTGNASPYSEAHFAFDPYAASLVFRSGVPLAAAGLGSEALMRDAGLPASCQLCAALAALDPGVVTLTEYFAEIETQSRLSLGQVVVDRDRRGASKANAGFVTGIDREKAAALIKAAGLRLP